MRFSKMLNYNWWRISLKTEQVQITIKDNSFLKKKKVRKVETEGVQNWWDKNINTESNTLNK